MDLGSLTSKLNELTFSLLLVGYKTCPPNWSKKEKDPSIIPFGLLRKEPAK